MPMIDITTVLTKLAERRPIFDSEADFQHALAWEIHQQWPACSIPLECKTPYLDDRSHLDIWAFSDNGNLAIELKYKTRGLRADVDEEIFSLKDQSAQDIGRYDFIKDIHRLEQVVFGRNDIVGYAILLTNDRSYWNLPRRNDTVDAEFRIHEGKTITGELSWSPQASNGTKRGREEPIVIEGTYTLVWQDYSEPKRAPYGKFRYLLVEVEKVDGR